MRHHRSGLLAQPGLVQAVRPEPVQQRRRGQNLVHRHNTGPADPGQHHVRPLRPLRLRQRGRLRHCRRRQALGPAPAPTPGRLRLSLRSTRPRRHHHERRTIPPQTRQIRIARSLIDPRLTPELGLHRFDAQTVRNPPAIATALAHRLVDDHQLRRLRRQPTLALPPSLGRASLVVNQNRDTRHLAQLPLHRIQIIAVPYPYPRSPPGPASIPPRIIADHHGPGHPLGVHHPRDRRRIGRAVGALPAGHRHRRVVQQLERDRRPGGHGLPDRQAAGVEKRAVAQVLEHVRSVSEQRLADPRDALTAHLSHAFAPVHERGHGVAPDAGAGARTLGDLGRAVVGAAGAEERRARHRRQRQRQSRPLRSQRRMPQVHMLGSEPVGQQPGQRARDPVGIELAVHRNERLPGGPELAVHHRPIRQRVKRLLDLGLDERTLLLDHDHGVQPGGEGAQRRAIGRIHHAESQNPYSKPIQRRRVQPQPIQRLPQLHIRPPRRDQPKAGAGGGHLDPVQPMRRGVGTRRREPAGQHLVFHRSRS